MSQQQKIISELQQKMERVVVKNIERENNDDMIENLSIDI